VLVLAGGVDVARGQCHANELLMLTASDAKEGDYFGCSASISGDLAVIGAFGNDDAGSEAGAAYVYRFDGTTWIEVTKLTASDPGDGDGFGSSVTIGGDVIVVGVAKDDNSRGSAYVFQRDHGGPDNWGEVKKLTASDGAADDRFGTSLSISGDMVVIGADGNDDAGSQSGSAYIFERNHGGQNNWGQVKKLTASDAAAVDRFGYAVSLSADVAVIGAFADDDGAPNAGSAYIFQRNYGGPDNWGEVTKLNASDPGGDDWFGAAVSISKDVALVGAFRDDEGAGDSGSAYIFDRNHGGPDNWGQVAKFSNPAPAADDHFGEAVAICGDVAGIGVQQDDDVGRNAGSAYLYWFDGTTWIEAAKLTASDGETLDFFGRNISISGDTALLGVLSNDDHGSQSGSAYIFRGLSDCNCNDVLDVCDIVEGTSEDANGNGVPDECESGCNGKVKIKKAKCNTKSAKVEKVIVVAKKATPRRDCTATLDTGQHLTRKVKSNGKVKFRFKGNNVPPCGPNGVMVCGKHKGFDCEC